MNRHNKLRFLIAASLLAMFVSVFSFASLPATAATASGQAFVARNLHQPTSTDPTNDYRLLTLNGQGSIKAIDTPAAIRKAGSLQFVGNLFVTTVLPDRLEVIDLASGTDTLYPAPFSLAPPSDGKPQGAYLNLSDVVSLNGGKQLLLDANPTWYLLDLASGVYTSIDMAKNYQHPLYYPFAQSPADGLIYANWGCQCDGGPNGIARYDLQGNREVLDLHLGKYMQANGTVTMSPAGRYLYFPANDPDQVMSTPNGPGIYANVIMRYRISDGTSSVIARANSGNLIGSYTLTSDDPYITYNEIVLTPNQSPEPTLQIQQTLIKRVNLATLAAPQTLITTPSSNVYPLLWCGSTFYYGTYDNGKDFTHSYSPATGKTYQVEGRLLGCAPLSTHFASRFVV